MMLVRRLCTHRGARGYCHTALPIPALLASSEAAHATHLWYPRHPGSLVKLTEFGDRASFNGYAYSAHTSVHTSAPGLRLIVVEG